MNQSTATNFIPYLLAYAAAGEVNSGPVVVFEYIFLKSGSNHVRGSIRHTCNIREPAEVISVIFVVRKNDWN